MFSWAYRMMGWSATDEKKKDEEKAHKTITVIQGPTSTTVRQCGASCSITKTPNSSLKSSSTGFAAKSYRANDEKSDAAISSFFTPELLTALKEAAKNGLLIGFAMALTEEISTEILLRNEFQPKNIYRINQVIKSLLLLGLFSATLHQAVTIPVLTHLIARVPGFSMQKATCATLAPVVSYDAMSSPLGVAGTLLTFFTGLATGYGASKATEAGYRYAKTTMRKSSSH